MGKINRATTEKRTRYAIYTRVSTTLDSQATSFINQNTDLEARVKSLYPDYELVRVYGDFGISGAKEKRPEFIKMISDANAGDFDVIVTKSISRFARNTELLLRTVNELKEHGVGVIFLENNTIDTRKDDDMLLITILAAIADEERKNTKSHIKETFAMKHAAGKMAKPYTKAFGYRIENGEPVIVEEEAAVVRNIFTWFVNDGLSAGAIARRLNANKIRNPRFAFGKGWSRSEIKIILGNSKYCGRPKETSATGEELFFEGPAIIDEATYNAAIKLLEEYSRQPKVIKMRSMASNFQPQKYPLSGMCKCAVCGGKVSRYTRKSTLTSGKYPLDLCEPAIDGTPLWGCLRNGSGLMFGPKCDTYKLSEQYLYEMIIEAISRCFFWRFINGIGDSLGSKSFVICEDEFSQIKDKLTIPIIKKDEVDMSAVGIPIYQELFSSIDKGARDKYNEEKEKYNKSIKDIDKQMKRVKDMFQDGDISSSERHARLVALQKEKDELKEPKTPEQIRISEEQLARIKAFFEGEGDLKSPEDISAALRNLFKDREIRRSLVRTLVEEVIIGGEPRYQATIKIKGFDYSLKYQVERRSPRRWSDKIHYSEVEYIGTIYED